MSEFDQKGDDTSSASMMPQRKRLLVSSAAVWLGYVVRFAVTFLVTPQLVHGLGDRRYGIWSLVESVLAYLSLFDLGVGIALVRYAARFEAQRNWPALNRAYSTCLAVFLGTGTLALLITLWLALGWARPLGAPAELAGDLRVLLILLGGNLAFGLPLGVYPTLLDGLGQFPRKVAVRTSFSLLSSVLMVLLVRSGYGLPAVGVVITVCTLVENLTMAFMVHRLLPPLRFSVRMVDWQTIRLIRGNSLGALLVLVAGRIIFQSDALVIGAFLAPQFITFFTIAVRLVDSCREAVRALTSPLPSAISAYEATENTAAIRRTFLLGTRAMVWFTMPVQVGLLILGRGFLSVWLGPSYSVSTFPVLVILAVPLAMSAAQWIAGRVLFGLGRLKVYAVIMWAEALIHLGLSLALIRPLGIRGVAIGGVVPSLISYLLVIVLVCRMLRVRARDYLTQAWLKPTLCGCGLLAFWVVLTAFFPITSWRGFLAIGFLGTAAYCVSGFWLEFGRARAVGLLRSLRERVLILMGRRYDAAARP